MRASGYNKIMNVPYLSGCFMFLRTEALKDVGLFDERFFMYPEDIDLTRRIHGKFRTVFFPEVSIIHHHAQSSYLNFRMLLIHIENMIKYFNKWGWIFDKERKKINREMESQFK
jgi:GT2 family glycosyltransferase